MDSTQTSSLEAIISRHLRSVEGQVFDRWRAVDSLLDMRAQTDSPAVVTEIDESLRTMPGKNLVEVEWWVGTLHKLMVASQPVGSRPH